MYVGEKSAAVNGQNVASDVKRTCLMRLIFERSRRTGLDSIFVL